MLGQIHYAFKSDGTGPQNVVACTEFPVKLYMCTGYINLLRIPNTNLLKYIGETTICHTCTVRMFDALCLNVQFICYVALCRDPSTHHLDG